MADDDGSMAWYQPQARALFSIEGIHVSQRLSRRIRQGRFEITFDACFEDVIRGCRRQDENWINEEIVRSYTRIHAEGWAHSCECWSDQELVGGVYGLALGGCFSAESMFHRVTDASKVALWALVNHCRELGFRMFDAQVMNPHLASLGAFSVPLDAFLKDLEAVLSVSTKWGPGIELYSSALA